MKRKKTILSILSLLLGLVGLQAQENITATGGEAKGTGGTVSYSIGQVIYTTATGTNGSVESGVQQPYKISTTVGINETTISLKLSIYPNPTTNYLTLRTEDNTNLSYQLYDMQGKIIETKIVSSNSINISIDEQPAATYFLNVVKYNQIIKTFKVIKN